MDKDDVLRLLKQLSNELRGAVVGYACCRARRRAHVVRACCCAAWASTHIDMRCHIADLDLGNAVDEVTGAIDPLVFLRDYVAPNKPLIIRGGVAHWPALTKWTRAHLEAAAGDALVTVDVTPNGRGDAVTPYGMRAM